MKSILNEQTDWHTNKNFSHDMLLHFSWPLLIAQCMLLFINECLYYESTAIYIMISIKFKLHFFFIYTRKNTLCIFHLYHYTEINTWRIFSASFIVNVFLFLSLTKVYKNKQFSFIWKSNRAFNKTACNCKNQFKSRDRLENTTVLF